MRLPGGFGRFASSDPDYAPFGIAWLRGLTLARVGLVALICALLAIRTAASLLVSNEDKPWSDRLLMVVKFFATAYFFPAAPALILITVVDNLSANIRTALRIGALAAAVAAGALIYCAVIFAWFPPTQKIAAVGMLRVFVSVLFRVVAWAGLLTAALFFITRERRTAAAARQAAVDRSAFEQQMAEAELRLLQAQIEPHFLFNTLANIQGLYRRDPPRGRRTMRDLATYLRAVLPDMRNAESTLRRELALAEAYLRVLQVRMGSRLRVEITVPHELNEASVPPLMLATLVENAIKHGIAPMRGGGMVRITVERAGERLRIAVSDNGAGFRAASGTGVGLANTRARLAVLFGNEASLRIAANVDAGVTATLQFPLRMARAVLHAA